MHTLTLLAESNAGYSNLIKLSSLGYLEGYYTKPRVDWELLERYSGGLIALSGCLSGRVCKALEENRPADAAADLRPARDRVRARLDYVELQNMSLDVQQRVNSELVKLAAEGELPLVATGDVHYLTAEDAYSHEALLCIRSGDSLKNPNHWKFETNEFYFKTPAEMALDFPGHEDAMRRTLEVAEPLLSRDRARQHPAAEVPDPERPRRLRLPRRALRPGARTATTRSHRSCASSTEFELNNPRDGLRRLLPDRVGLHPLRQGERDRRRGPAAARPPARSPRTRSRSPTSIKYDLLFERFLNPGRKSMPDIDIDFAVEGRERVINYVSEKYGRDRVAQIITFGTDGRRHRPRHRAGARDPGVVDRVADDLGPRWRTTMELYLGWLGQGQPGQARPRRSSGEPRPGRSRGSSGGKTRSTPPGS